MLVNILIKPINIVVSLIGYTCDVGMKFIFIMLGISIVLWGGL